jgi:tRNA(fMet)-specific endonuclease VapC
MVVLDTDHFSILERRDSPERMPLVRRLETSGQPVATTIISYEEQSRGWLAYVARARSKTDQLDAYGRLAKHLNAYRSITVLQFDETAFEKYIELKRDVSMGTLDLKIAAITLAHDALLLSRNLKDFEQVRGLKVEDWLS